MFSREFPAFSFRYFDLRNGNCRTHLSFHLLSSGHMCRMVLVIVWGLELLDLGIVLFG
jgi:hypothetical protein